MEGLYSFCSSQKCSFLHENHTHTHSGFMVQVPGAISQTQSQFPEPAGTSERHYNAHRPDTLSWKKQMIFQTKTNIEMLPMHMHNALKCASGG